MAHFYGSINGSAKTTATRGGTSSSGIHSHIRGWDSGVQVFGRNEAGDKFAIEATYGSNDRGRAMPLGEVRENADGTVSFFPSEHLIEAMKTAEGGELRF